MSRIKNRRWGLGQTSVHAAGATHVIKIGAKTKSKSGKEIPCKLPGFLICRDTLGPDGKPLIDHASMQRLGKQYTPEAIQKANDMKLAAPVGILPTVLHFALRYDAVMTSDGWDYPQTYAEEYECYRREGSFSGRFCHGDGLTALRNAGDGTQKMIDCVPVGRSETEAKQFCDLSVKKECKAHSRLILCLFVVDENNRPQPLSPELGWEARFRFDTSSEHYGPRVLAELDQAADRLEDYSNAKGRLNGINGTLSFHIQNKRHGSGLVPTGQVIFSLCEDDITRKEIKMRRLMIEDRHLMALPAPETAPAALPNPFDSQEDEEPAPVSTPLVEAEETPAAAPAEPAAQAPPEVVEPEIIKPLCETASVEDLCAALLEYVAAKDISLETVAYFTTGEEKKRTDITEIEWFTSGEGDTANAARHDWLRHICKNIDEQEDGAISFFLPTEEG